jgi:hypothetical protein
MVAHSGSEQDEEEQAVCSQQGILLQRQGSWFRLGGEEGGGCYTLFKAPAQIQIQRQLSLKVMDCEAWQRNKLRAWMGTLGGCRDDKKNEWASWTDQAVA